MNPFRACGAAARMLILFAVMACCAPAGAKDPLPFLMSEDFEDLDMAAWRVEPGRPDQQNPLVEPAMPWDSGAVAAHGSVVRDPIDGRFKAWQVSIPAIGLVPDGGKWFVPRITYLESDDGVEWRRPELDFVPWEGHAKTNILMDTWASYASVNIDPARKDAPYEMFLFRDPRQGSEAGVIAGLPLPPGATQHPYGLYRYRSRDGISWKPVEGPLALESADSCYIYKFGEGYTCLHKTEIPAFPGGLTPFDVADGGIRLIGLRTSADGSTWTDPPAIVMSPDWRDPADTQFMELCPVPMPGGYAAMITVYHNMTQTIDLQWGASRDGVHWWRPERRPAVANAPLGDFGGGMIWQMNSPVREGDRLHVYYSGTEGLHGDLYNTRGSGPRRLHARGETLTRQSSAYSGDYGALCRATWDVHRLWALAPAHGGYTPGTAITKKADLAGKSLAINLRTRPGGELRVELLDSSGSVLNGFSQTDCRAVDGDHRSRQVTWQGGDRAPDRAAKARFILKRAFLYGLEWRE